MTRPSTRVVKPGSDQRLFFPDAPFPHGIQLIFKKYDYSKLAIGGKNDRSKFSSAQEKGLMAIELPMPSSLTDATGLSINSMEKSFVESFIADTLAPMFSSSGGGIGAIGSGLFEAGEAGIKGLAGALSGIASNKDGANAEIAAQGSRVLSFLMSNTLNSFSPGLGKAMGSTRGTAINPQATLAFEGVNLRSFTLDWTLYPESRSEAEAIKKIIRAIKKQILPEVESVLGNTNALSGQEGTQTLTGAFSQAALSRAFLTYPATVNINLLGVDETHFVRFKPCMCDNITIDYGASGEIIIAEKGVPQGVKISMSFKELEIQTANDYADEEAAPTLAGMKGAM